MCSVGQESSRLQESRVSVKKKQQVIVCDLDSTLANTYHREHLAPEMHLREPVENWIPYSKACIDDTVIEGVKRALNLYAEAGMLIHFVSGRNIEALAETIQWLDANEIHWDFVRLHRHDDLRHNGEYKSAYINSLREDGFEPVLMFEDHVSVCEMIEERTGVPCVTVRPRYEDSVGVSFNLSEYPELAK